MNNPFTPVFGTVPLYPAGRDIILNDMHKAFLNWTGSPDITSILIGPRGSGKTALLYMIAEQAKKEGWIVTDTIARKGMLEDIYQDIIFQADFLDPYVIARLSSVGVANVEFGIERIEKEKQNWRSKMSSVMSQFSNMETGLLILVDEVLPDLEEMVDLAAIYQLLRQRYPRTSLVMAGLPANIYDLLNNKSVSFLRRARQRFLGRIPDQEIELSFKKTLEKGGKQIDDKDLKQIVKTIDGFAYMMQLTGYYIWEASGEKTKISSEDVRKGIEYAVSEFRIGILDHTFQELSDMDKKFLYAMLKDDDFSNLTDVSNRMGKTTGYCSSYKKKIASFGRH
ncbi:MAG: ATP-binding protein [Erysipelotrichaceae bacterium]|nr:ATP-binding protein [Erysipelotrichaceae bacterium]